MELVQGGKPRRPHFKTRTGCLNCKKRKIKCDELKPTCSKCKQHEVACLYISKPPFGFATIKTLSTSPARDRVTRVSETNYGQPEAFTTLDLELMHSWTSTSGPITFLERPAAMSTLHLTLVDIALKEPFVMHEILSLSALYLAQTRPHLVTQYTLASNVHHDQALSLFQPALASLNRSNCDACFAFSILITIYCCASQTASSSQNPTLASPTIPLQELTYIQSIKMYRGNNAVHAAVHPWLNDGLLAEFRPWKELLEISTPKPLVPIEQQYLDSLAETWSFSSHPDAVKETLDKALGELRNFFSLAASGENGMEHIAVLAWFSLIPEEFVDLLEASLPEAMLILASYTVVLKRIEYIWWCRGVAEGLLTVTRDILGGEESWAEHLKWPIEKVLGGGVGTRS